MAHLPRWTHLNTASIPKRAVWRIVLLYGGFAALWIWSSDALLAWAVPDAAAMARAGWTLALVGTALMSATAGAEPLAQAMLAAARDVGASA